MSAREESQTKYEGLGATESAEVAARVFPGEMAEPAGGLPSLPEGERVVGYPSNDAAQVSLPEGRRGLIESSGPIAVESPHGRVPVNLGIVSVGDGFEPATPLVPVRISKGLAGGVVLFGAGVSLTALDGAGMPAVGEGQVRGPVVFYGGASTGRDVDMVVKPTTYGFSENVILRSKNSPTELAFRVGLPEGASLVQAENGSVVNVVKENSVIASIPAPAAQDASGASVPVSTRVEGNRLLLSLGGQSGSYEYPVMVDPEVEDTWLYKEKGHTTNWHFEASPGSCWFKSRGNSQEPYLILPVTESHTGSEWGAFEYTTQGESYITTFKSEEGRVVEQASHLEGFTELVSSKGTIEEKAALPEQTTRGSYDHEICVGACQDKLGSGNSAEFYFTATHAGEGHTGILEINKAYVRVFQNKGPEIAVDTTHETVDGGKKNVFYGSGGWLGPNSGSGFELHAKDPGVGVSYYAIHAGSGTEVFSETNNYIENSECTGGVQCFPEVNKGYGYLSQLPEGEVVLEATAKDATGSEVHLPSEKLKVDKAPPYNVTLSELPSSHELVDGEHVTLKASATDGTSPTPSSGVGSIVLEVDGQPVGSGQGYCSPGPCTGHGEWTISGENYPAGEHTLTVVATDNAGNVATSEYHVVVHHPEGVAVGPGSVNPVTGELSLNATDVSVSVPNGALTVARSYRSRHLAQGTEGPLGPQWSLALGGEQSLYRVSGGMVLTGEAGGQLVFESKGSGEFASPTGDAGLVLREKTTEGKTLFTLSENGSVTTFRTACWE